MYNTIFLISGIILLVIFGFSVSIIHIRALRDDLSGRWYNLADKLQYRQDMIPNLIETIKLFVPAENFPQYAELIQKTIDLRVAAAKNTHTGHNKIVQEHDLSEYINQLFEIGQKHENLAISTNFLELKKEFSDLNKQLHDLSDDYNKHVRHHNSLLSRPYNILPAVVMRYKRKLIFDFE
ncbi:LemA family protein [Candidatus Peregrinibacteria bacterium]|nr:LemA family protein [Candidatus Peregrinibacteria bacterium]